MVRAYIESPLADVHIAAIDDSIRDWLSAAVLKDAIRYAARDTGYMKTHIFRTPDHRRVIAPAAGIPPKRFVPAYVEFGTRPHRIPNAFGWGITVWHPGTHAQPFLRPAAYRKRAIPPWAVQARASLADR